MPLRLVALRLTCEQTENAVRRTRTKATQDTSKVSPVAYGAGWLLTAGPLPATAWTPGQWLTLSRTRWHLALLFQQIKPLHKVHQLRCEHRGRARASMLTSLLCWALQAEDGAQILSAIRQEHDDDLLR